jgi:protease-4
MSFLRNILSTVIGVFLALMIMFLFFLFFVAIAGSGTQKRVVVKNNSVIKLRFNKPIKDYGGKYSFKKFNYSFVDYNGLNHIIHAIEVAKTDDKIDGISINTKGISAGMAQLKALRNALEDFKSSGKFVYAYSDIYPQKDYYLASVADSVFINPIGEINFRGLSSEVLFYKDFQEKSGIKAEVVRHGKFKSAVEPYLENEMSEANRLQVSELLHSMWAEMLNDISESRKLTVDELNRIADNLGGSNPNKAVSNKLVDGTMFNDEYHNLITRSSAEDFNYISMERYAEYASKKNKSKAAADKIAIIFAQGMIIYGEGSDSFIGQGMMIKALRKAREDASVKAVVLRVDSPGGSALASDIIWREVKITNEVKPVVVSMGDLAASGGYYIAMGGQKIFAEPTTITGSIGVFGLLPNFQQLADRIGINAEQVETNKQSAGYSVFEPMNETIYTEIEQSIEATYDTFLKRVAENRGLTVAEVDSIAQGRVWSGTEAKTIGLVDEIGGLNKAIEAAAEIAELKEYRTISLPEYITDLDEVLGKFSGLPGLKSSEEIIKQEIGTEAYEVLQQIKELSRLKGVQARLPFELKIR